MWILTSLSRPDRIRKVVESYVWGNGESRVILALWEGDPRLQEYLEQDWPANWHTALIADKGVGPTYNHLFKAFPNEQNYGFLADDAILNAQGMLRLLENEAKNWNMSYPDDGIHGERMATMPCIGGDLVRACGFLSPPGFMHEGIDVIWTVIAQKLGFARYMPQLSYTHVHPLMGRAKWDKTYIDARNSSIGHQDLIHQFVTNGSLDRIVQTVRGRKLQEQTS